MHRATLCLMTACGFVFIVGEVPAAPIEILSRQGEAKSLSEPAAEEEVPTKTRARTKEIKVSKRKPGTIRNGDFEDPMIGRSPYRAFGSELPGWTIESGTVDVVGNYWVAAKGKQSLDLSGHGPAVLSQEIETVPGTTYELRFAAAGNPEPYDQMNVKKFRVVWGDRELSTITMDAKGRSFEDVGWRYYAFEVVAVDKVTTLTFECLSPTFCGPILDDITLRRVKKKR
ncbi:Halomucin [Durusdinium trenchii]|uniref:Halomucin n=1 Tax=Durusdinium trenchii TaxID=1381693 RepID=A0ABP0QGS4_9DINO